MQTKLIRCIALFSILITSTSCTPKKDETRELLDKAFIELHQNHFHEAEVAFREVLNNSKFGSDRSLARWGLVANDLNSYMLLRNILVEASLQTALWGGVNYFSFHTLNNMSAEQANVFEKKNIYDPMDRIVKHSKKYIADEYLLKMKKSKKDLLELCEEMGEGSSESPGIEEYCIAQTEMIDFKLAEAKKYCGKIKSNGDQSIAIYNTCIGDIAYFNGDYSEAVLSYDVAEKILDKDYTGFGRILRFRDKKSIALLMSKQFKESFSRFISLDNPENATFLILVAKPLLTAGLKKEAKQALENFVSFINEYESRYLEALESKGYSVKDINSQTIKALETLIQIYAEDKDMTKLLETLDFKESYDESEDDKFQTASLKSHLYCNTPLNDYPNCLTEANKALRLNPDSGEMALYLYIMLRVAGDDQKALQIMTSAKERALERKDFETYQKCMHVINNHGKRKRPSL
jgi:tetratricopeptide (TPR) repeat protein